jgi:hypothetical protein
LVVDLAGGQMIEAAMIGRDSMPSGSSALDGLISLNRRGGYCGRAICRAPTRFR